MDEAEAMRKYFQQLSEEKERQLSSHEATIKSFLELCENRNVKDSEVEFDYISTTGVIAKHKDLLLKIKPELPVDKDNLVPWSFIKDELKSSNQMEGYIDNEHFVIMAHPYFRRAMHPLNNWAPLFIHLFWQLDDSPIDAYLALDFDRVRIDTEPFFLMEADTWFGAPFDENISNIPDGISKLRPPLDLNESSIGFIFRDAYSLEVKWSTKGRIRTFQALEFKSSSVTIELDETIYHPVRYIHAEFDLETSTFRHFDGAVQHYLPEEYFHRRDSDFNHDFKSSKAIKAKSKKLFKFNGQFNVEFWVDFCCHFMTGNPLVYEYFTGSYPARICEMLQNVRDRMK